jgi:hypothetical protein
LVGTGDFNGDGMSDLLWQNTNGQVATWQMNGFNVTSAGVVADPGPTWTAIGTGAGGSDILLQNTSGQAAIWEMSGSTMTGGSLVNPSPGPTWRAVGLT